jgi:acyl carrier protein
MVAYVEPSFGFERLQPSALRSPLTKHLPRYMVPATIKIIEQLPRLSNLKLDRVRLAQMDAECIAEMINPVDDPLITEIIKLFESVLGSLRITPGDNVSSLGGDSLQAIKVALELELRFGIAIPVEVFESMQSIRELARWLTTRFEPLDDI